MLTCYLTLIYSHSSILIFKLSFLTVNIFIIFQCSFLTDYSLTAHFSLFTFDSSQLTRHNFTAHFFRFFSQFLLLIPHFSLMASHLSLLTSPQLDTPYFNFSLLTTESLNSIKNLFSDFFKDAFGHSYGISC